MRWTGQIKFAVDVPLHVCYRKPAVKKKGGVVHLGSNDHDRSDKSETKEKKVGGKVMEHENDKASYVSVSLSIK